MKSMHDLDCDSRQSKKCNCKIGWARRVKKAASDSLERRGNEIIEVDKLYEHGWLKQKLTGKLR